MAIAAAATRLGIVVSRPLSDGARYDLVFDLGAELVRVQCKWAARAGEVLCVRCWTSRRAPKGHIRSVYTADEVDAIAAYCPDLQRCYFVPMASFQGWRAVQLRLGPTKNNQQRGIHWAEAFEFEATLPNRLGP